MRIIIQWSLKKLPGLIFIVHCLNGTRVGSISKMILWLCISDQSCHLWQITCFFKKIIIGNLYFTKFKPNFLRSFEEDSWNLLKDQRPGDLSPWGVLLEMIISSLYFCYWDWSQYTWSFCWILWGFCRELGRSQRGWAKEARSRRKDKTSGSIYLKAGHRLNPQTVVHLLHPWPLVHSEILWGRSETEKLKLDWKQQEYGSH